jgi:hypothetical protein
MRSGLFEVFAFRASFRQRWRVQCLAYRPGGFEAIAPEPMKRAAKPAERSHMLRRSLRRIEIVTLALQGKPSPMLRRRDQLSRRTSVHGSPSFPSSTGWSIHRLPVMGPQHVEKQAPRPANHSEDRGW